MFGSQARPGLGSLGGDSLGAMTYNLESLGAADSSAMNSAPITAYGLRVARDLLDTVKEMPPDFRKRQLALALGRIDPKLWSRAEQAADVLVKRGVPAATALERGLASAMSFGLSTELIAMAEGKRPESRSQLGAALEALGEEATRAGYCWIAQYTRASDGAVVPGHWERMRTGQTGCVGAQPAGVAAPVVRDQRDGGAGSGGGVTVTDAAGNVIRPIRPPVPPPTTSPSADKFLKVGPFMVPLGSGTWRDHRTLPPEQRAYVDENIALAAKAGGISVAEMKTGRYPFVKFKANGNENWGLFYRESAATTSSRGTAIPAERVVSFQKLPAGSGGESLGDMREALGWSITGVVSDIGGAIKDVAKAVGGAVWSVLKKVWSGIKWVAVKIADFVVDAVKFVAKWTCKITNTPGVVQGAQAIAMAAPNPYTVGIAAGITITGMLCDKYGNKAGSKEAEDAAAADAAAEAERLRLEEEAAAKRKKMMVPLALLGGGGLLLLVVMRMRKRP
jgi:hypothetical protein